MRDLHPTAPKSLNPYARELLEALAGHPEAAEVVLGGGVALSHYLEYRGTVDLDAWWREAADPKARQLVSDSMQAIATRHGLEFRLRKWGDTESYELLQGRRKVFSFHVERLELQRPLASIVSTEERARAAAVRDWFKGSFCGAEQR